MSVSATPRCCCAPVIANIESRFPVMSIEGNHMSQGACYSHRYARDMALVSLLRAAHRLFSGASIIQNLDRLSALRNRGFPIEEVHTLYVQLDSPFLDAFRIATSFENLFKAELLAFGYVVHKVDGRTHDRKFEDLAKAQLVGPIRVTQVKRAEGSSWKRHGPFTIVSLRSQTLTLGQLINDESAYTRSLRLSQQLRSALKFVREQRNTVHFVVNDAGRFNSHVVDWYLCLRATMNRRLIPRYRALIDRYTHLRDNPMWALNEI